MELLLFYLGLALGVSFLCSLVEAGLLSVSVSHGVYLKNQGHPAGAHLEKMKRDIDRPLAAILTLNTVSHTVGASGVGAQALVVFGEGWVALTSAVLTVLILVLSEIVPKTIGATYARPMTPFVVATIRGMIFLTLPIVYVLDALSRLMRGSSSEPSVTQEQLAIMADLAGDEGSISDSERTIVSNALRLKDVRVREVMTPRTVVFSIDAADSVGEVAKRAGFRRFSRIPVMEGDAPKGVVLRYDIYEMLRAGRTDEPVGNRLRELIVVPDSARMTDVLDRFAESGHHMFQVADEHGTYEGVITLEDVLETMLGREIMDETDPIEDMRDLAAVRASVSPARRENEPS